MSIGGSQQRRRKVSGVSRFSIGTDHSSEIDFMAARACERRACANGFRTIHTLGGGGPSLFLESSGKSSSGMASARSIALHQFRKYFSAPRPWKARIAINPAEFVGGFDAAATIALSGRIRPGAMSRDCAIPSRSIQSNLTMASARRFFTWCKPEVRRQGSSRGGDGGAASTDANSSFAHSSFPLSRNTDSTSSRNSTKSSTSSAA